jgi:hypothetical protein
MFIYAEVFAFIFIFAAVFAYIFPKNCEEVLSKLFITKNICLNKILLCICCPARPFLFSNQFHTQKPMLFISSMSKRGVVTPLGKSGVLVREVW